MVADLQLGLVLVSSQDRVYNADDETKRERVKALVASNRVEEEERQR